ncbi:Gfo/Idh/MocA family oxidoreductase [Salegentibacter salinarum]|uniref:Gfo/Idh/MocA family oxidoreductase n=1 Tax=Salegentibacter salinarum TaxID=447422 RepID=UPI0012FF3D71|nr:Gfo/Idh/MocA family oxidoreductase [Salegentibacter salinarum]
MAKQNFPEDGLGKFGVVTHIWTQDIATSKHIAASAKIEVVVENLEDMLGKVDAVLLARDDAKNHYKMAFPFLKAGIPIFIDKPLALSVKEANKILKEQQYENQVFSCSSIRFAKELDLTEKEKDQIGEIVHVEAAIPKKWDTYAIHIIEPIIARLPHRGKLLGVKCLQSVAITNCIVKWENTTAYLKVTGTIPITVSLNFYGEKGCVTKEFSDSYTCFKNSLHKFVKVINKEEENIKREETLEIIKILEKGRK